MVKNIKKVLLIIVLITSSNLAISQFGVSAGMSVLKGFGVSKPYIGLHFGGELPRDNQISLYARLSLYARQQEPTSGYTIVTAIEPTTFPYSKTITYTPTLNYTIIEGGTRYYIGNGYDSGFGAYGGSTVMLALNTVKRKYENIESGYELPGTEMSKGTIFNLGFGLGGGIKNTFAGIGTVYLDMNLAYLILSTASNSTAQNTSLYSPLLFSFNLGFRKEFY